MTMTLSLTPQVIQSKIYHLPNRLKPFMLGQDLAEIYEVEPKHIIRGVKRNPKRFPDDFYFQLTDEELVLLKRQNVTLYSPRANPYGFYREGANMLSVVLKSDVAAERSVEIMRAFSALEEKFSTHQPIKSIGSYETLNDKLESCQYELLKVHRK